HERFSREWSPDVCSSVLEIGADVILRPVTTQLVSQILAICNEARQPIVVHGGMSGWVRATETQPGELALSLERMSVVESIDPVTDRNSAVEGNRCRCW